MLFSTSKEKQVLNFLSFLTVITKTQTLIEKFYNAKWQNVSFYIICNIRLVANNIKTVLINFKNGLNCSPQAFNYDSKFATSKL